MEEKKIRKRNEYVFGTFLGESLSKIGEHEYLKYEERKKEEEERRKRNNVIKNIFLWPLYFIVGIASAYCYQNKLFPFFTVGIIIMIGVTISLVKSKCNFILFSLLSLIGIAFFWQFKMWWWLAGMFFYLVLIFACHEASDDD